MIPVVSSFTGTPPLNHEARYCNYKKCCKIVSNIYWLNTSCEPHGLATQLQKPTCSGFSLAKDLILRVPFASCYSKMKWCHRLHNPKPAISELGDYSGVTFLKWMSWFGLTMKKIKGAFSYMELGRKEKRKKVIKPESHSSSPREVDSFIKILQFFCGHFEHIYVFKYQRKYNSFCS